MRLALQLWVGVAVAATLAAACSGPRDVAAADATSPAAPPASAGRRLRIAMIAKSATNPSFVAARLGAETRARELTAQLGRPVEIEWLTPPQESGAAQAERIAQAVKDGLDAVLVSCSDALELTPAIDDAVARGVPVMTFDSDAPDSKRFAYIGVDDFKAGETIMAELAHLLDGNPERVPMPSRDELRPAQPASAPRVTTRGARIAVLAGNRNAPNLRRRVEGVLHEASRHPDIKIVGTYFHVETPEEASAAVMRAQAAHPEITGWAMVGGWALYTRTLLRELAPRADARRGRPAIQIVSINALPPQLAYVEAGMAPVLLAQPTYLWGARGVEIIVDKLLARRPAPAPVPAQLVRVTAQNLRAWAHQLRDWGFADVPEEYLAP
jgi:ribose transport system substrate-binding protein